MDIDYYKNKIKRILGFPVEINYLTNEGYQKLDYCNLYYIKNSKEGITIEIRKDNATRIALFTLVQLPGCCGVIVSTGAIVIDTFRGKGIGRILNKFRQDIAKYLDYTVFLCTDVENNIHQKRILDDENFKHIYKFKNKRTGNIVNISIKELNENSN